LAARSSSATTRLVDDQSQSTIGYDGTALTNQHRFKIKSSTNQTTREFLTEEAQNRFNKTDNLIYIVKN
jgi:hypothetical protein